MANDYLTFQTNAAPTWLQQPYGKGWNAAWGLFKDMMRIGASDAITAAFPLLAPEDALPVIANERGLEPMPGENETTYRQRLVAAWTTWGLSGSIQAIANAIVLVGFPAAQVTIAQAWGSIASALNPVPVFPSPPFPPNTPVYPAITVQAWPTMPTTSSYIVVLNPATPWVSEGTWGDGQVWGDGGTWGSTATLEQVNLLRRCIARYSPAHATCAGIIVVFSGAVPTDGTNYLTPASWGAGPGGTNGSAAYWLP